MIKSTSLMFSVLIERFLNETTRAEERREPTQLYKSVCVKCRLRQIEN